MTDTVEPDYFPQTYADDPYRVLNVVPMEHPGTEMMRGHSPTGAMNAAGDVDSVRLMKIAAEIIKVQWNPWQISERNLPFLAWAMGVNLWEEWWSLEFKRWWVANQWWLKSIRGTRRGLEEFTRAVGGDVRRVITPPARTYPQPKLTDEQRAAYVARFQQLRLYPYWPRRLLPYVCWLGRSYGPMPEPLPSGTWVPPDPRPRNGGYLGPIRPVYPTNFDQGGRYTRFAKLYEPRTGVETDLTFRTVTMIDVGSETVRTWDEVVTPGHPGTLYHIHEPKKWLRPPNQTKRGIFLGTLDPTERKWLRIPRDGQLDLALAKAQYVTAKQGVDFIEIYPEHVGIVHPRRDLTELYLRKREFLNGKFLPPSNAYQYLYERWYVFDPDRAPDYKTASVFLGNTRLGIHKYTAEAKIKITGKMPRHVLHANGYVHGFFRKRNTEAIDRLRRGVTASMALRDTVLLDTRVLRPIQLRDVILPDGSHTVGQLVKD